MITKSSYYKDKFHIVDRSANRKRKSLPRFHNPYVMIFNGGQWMQHNDYYVYVHRRKDTGEVFYVGKGRKYRWLSKSGRNKIWKSVVSETDWFAEKYKENLAESEAVEIELDLIQTLNPSANILKSDLRANKLDTDFIFERYEYDENSPSGLIYKVWNGQYCKKRKDKGDVAGLLSSNGYYRVAINSKGKHSGNHRVIWFLMTGEDPLDDIIDHVDGDRQNNRFENLRRIPRWQNNRNLSLRKDNKFGVQGVQYLKEGFYCASMNLDGKRISKNFSIRKFGEDLALELACYYRLKMVENSGYTERHIGTFDFKILNNMSEEEIDGLINDDLVSNNTTGISNIYYCNVKGAEYWEFRYARNKPRRFSVLKYGHDIAKALAVEYKSRFFGNAPSNIEGFSLEETERMLSDNTKVGNTTGVKHLSFVLRRGKYLSILVQRRINGKNYTKRFSVNKYGLDVAKDLAIAYLKEIEEKLLK